MKTTIWFRGLIRCLTATGLLIISCARTIPYPESSQWSKTGITKLKTIKIDGLKHEILIRGTDKDNPVILFIHGLGIPSMCFAHLEYAQVRSAYRT